jgi:hypothetical protein
VRWRRSETVGSSRCLASHGAEPDNENLISLGPQKSIEGSVVCVWEKVPDDESRVGASTRPALTSPPLTLSLVLTVRSLDLTTLPSLLRPSLTVKPSSTFFSSFSSLSSSSSSVFLVSP